MAEAGSLDPASASGHESMHPNALAHRRAVAQDQITASAARIGEALGLDVSQVINAGFPRDKDVDQLVKSEAVAQLLAAVADHVAAEAGPLPPEQRQRARFIGEAGPGPQPGAAPEAAPEAETEPKKRGRKAKGE